MLLATRIGLLILALAFAAPVRAGDYLVRPGDVLRVEVLEDPAMNRDTLVTPDGRIHLPFVGSVAAGGRSVDQIRAGLATALADDFAIGPTVFVGVSSVAPSAPVQVVPAPAETLSVYVMGEVAKPGHVEVAPGTTVLQVLATVGGFSDFAATKRIQLRRSHGADEAVYALNYDAVERGQSADGQVPVADGDTLIVPARRLFE
ncbi:polysaccharide export outer membrane protein [Palleronia marisminoris]|uniref:Polysaccharide biosynthesis/export protein n=1 Tax=Palleronia marisminoris TaxID=315423 RepID=A0A1Y5SM20_9RHOB|nr:polysaccharide biosynthesis/export family protein [Palleronia marisminoris]SFG82915.1 polysaccharide export outer membrane protein [Palleronia marisminoris]SLN40771.1 Polysaccharide biosynthesis/export protein [Palleronia marisminoris]